jgi:transcriptional regulator with XRE-family HTH domain
MLKISQKELADISGVGLRKLVDIENAKANPTMDTLLKIMDTLGLQFDVRAK